MIYNNVIVVQIKIVDKMICIGNFIVSQYDLYIFAIYLKHKVMHYNEKSQNVIINIIIIIIL